MGGVGHQIQAAKASLDQKVKKSAGLCSRSLVKIFAFSEQLGQ